MLCLGLHGLCRVYTEQFRSTQSLHRANPVNTESIQSDLGSTQSLHNGMRTYTGSTQNNMGSTQSLHRAITLFKLRGVMRLSFAPITTVHAVPRTYLELETSEIYEFLRGKL